MCTHTESDSGSDDDDDGDDDGACDNAAARLLSYLAVAMTPYGICMGWCVLNVTESCAR